jgi:HPt (histidine-containing phosphotransfer) domain-containing protein
LSHLSVNGSTAVYSALGADPELAELVELFVEEMPERIARLLNALDDQDWSALTRTAHQLKGAAGSYGFHQVTPLANQLEIKLRNREPEAQIRQATLDLVKLCRQARSGVQPGQSCLESNGAY